MEGLQQGQRESATTAEMMAWAVYDWANSAFPTVIQTFVFAAYFTRQIAANETVGSNQWGNTISLAGLIIALLGPVLGSIADQGRRRKPWIAVFTVLCVVATGLLWFIEPHTSFLIPALILVGIGTVASEFAFIFYNAMLPDLVNNRQMGRWSGWGWGLGYAGGLACLIVSLFVFVQADSPPFGLDPNAAEHVRATFVLVAVWYLLFAIPLFIWTPDVRGTGMGMKKAVTQGLQQLRNSISNVRNYSNILKFLFARMFYMDGLTTIFSFGGIYAAGTFNMSEEQVIMFGIALNVMAGLGAFLFSWIDDRRGSKFTILSSLGGLLIPTILILFVTSNQWFWILGMFLGIFVGPVQAASRTFMGRLAPAEIRNEMFGLFALSGKITSFLGPLLVGWLTYWAGSQRVGMSAIVLFLLMGFILLLSVKERSDLTSSPKNSKTQ